MQAGPEASIISSELSEGQKYDTPRNVLYSRVRESFAQSLVDQGRPLSEEMKYSSVPRYAVSGKPVSRDEFYELRAQSYYAPTTITPPTATRQFDKGTGERFERVYSGESLRQLKESRQPKPTLFTDPVGFVETTSKDVGQSILKVGNETRTEFGIPFTQSIYYNLKGDKEKSQQATREYRSYVESTALEMGFATRDLAMDFIPPLIRGTTKTLFYAGTLGDPWTIKDRSDINAYLKSEGPLILDPDVQMAGLTFAGGLASALGKTSTSIAVQKLTSGGIILGFSALALEEYSSQKGQGRSDIYSLTRSGLVLAPAIIEGTSVYKRTIADKPVQRNLPLWEQEQIKGNFRQRVAFIPKQRVSKSGGLFTEDAYVMGETPRGQVISIGGDIKPGETPRQAIIREVGEETNLIFENLPETRYVGEYFTGSENVQLFTGRIPEGRTINLKSDVSKVKYVNPFEAFGEDLKPITGMSKDYPISKNNIRVDELALINVLEGNIKKPTVLTGRIREDTGRFARIMFKRESTYDVPFKIQSQQVGLNEPTRFASSTPELITGTEIIGRQATRGEKGFSIYVTPPPSGAIARPVELITGNRARGPRLTPEQIQELPFSQNILYKEPGYQTALSYAFGSEYAGIKIGSKRPGGYFFRDINEVTEYTAKARRGKETEKALLVGDILNPKGKPQPFEFKGRTYELVASEVTRPGKTSFKTSRTFFNDYNTGGYSYLRPTEIFTPYYFSKASGTSVSGPYYGSGYKSQGYGGTYFTPINYAGDIPKELRGSTYTSKSSRSYRYTNPFIETFGEDGGYTRTPPTFPVLTGDFKPPVTYKRSSKSKKRKQDSFNIKTPKFGYAPSVVGIEQFYATGFALPKAPKGIQTGIGIREVVR